jgi:hypothetical protein
MLADVPACTLKISDDQRDENPGIKKHKRFTMARLSPSPLPQTLLSGRSLTRRNTLTDAAGSAFENGAPRTGDRRDFLRQTQAEECGGICGVGEDGLTKAIQNLRAESPGAPAFQMLPIIPNVLEYVREATEYGLAGAGMRRVLRTGLGGVIRAGLTGLCNAPAVLRKQFPAALKLLYDLEMGEMRHLQPPVVFLHHTITDMAVAFGHRKLLEDFVRAMRSGYHAEPGFATSNFLDLTKCLEEWNIAAAWISAPLNPQGYLMPGGLDACQRVLQSGKWQLIADRVAPEIPTPSDAVEWALSQPGVASVIVEK